MKKSTTVRVRMDPKARREQLMNSAMDVALKRGLDNVTREDVSFNAKVSTALISYYFATTNILKKEIVQYALEKEIVPIIAQALSIKLASPDWITPTLKARVVNYLTN